MGAACGEQPLFTCKFPTKHKALNLQRFPSQCLGCPLLLGPCALQVLSEQLLFSHPLNEDEDLSALIVRPLTFCSHLAVDHGAELIWFLHLQNI